MQPGQYEDDSGDVATLPATVAQSQDVDDIGTGSVNPYHFVATDIDFSDAGAFPHAEENISAVDNETRWSIDESSTAGSMAVLDSTTAPGVEALEVSTSSQTSSDTAVTTFSDVSITSDAEKRYLRAMLDVNSLDSGATVELRAVDSDGDYVATTINSSATASDADELESAADDTEQLIAFGLGVRCGLRSAEILEVAPQDIVETDAGWMLRIHNGKGDKYRETPIPENLAMRIQTIGDIRNEASDEPVLSIKSTRSLRRWLQDTREKLAEETGDVGWNSLSTHDLRRTWATALADAEVDPLLVLDWGGWNDLETFLDHYRGSHSPAAQRRAREKVDWL